MRCIAVGWIVSVVVASGAVAQEGREADASRPVLVLTGADSHDRTGFHRVATDAALQELWLRHLGKTEDDRYRGSGIPAIHVDFDKYMVAVIVQVERRTSRGLEIVSVREQDDAVVLRYRNLSYQTSGPPGAGPPPVPVTGAYAFVVLPRSGKPLVIEEATGALKGQPPQWQRRARIAAG
jgi:hypothetical protein